MDDVDVEAALLPRDAAHPVLRDPHRALRVLRIDPLAEAGAGARLREADDRLELAGRDGHGGARGFARLPDLEVLGLDRLHGLRGHHRGEPLRVGDVLSEEHRLEVGRVRFRVFDVLVEDLLSLRPPPAPLPYEMAPEDVLRHVPITLRLGVVDEGENNVEPRQQSRGKIDLLGDELRFVEPSELRVGGREDRAPRLQDRGDSRLRDADSLLLHRLMDCGTILRVHLL